MYKKDKMTKGIVSIIEMVITAIILLTAFSIIFHKNVYLTNWDKVMIMLNGRDFTTMIDRSGKLYYYSYNQTALKYEINKILGPAFISWLETNNLIKNRLSIACNCTNSQINALNSWLYGLSINNRQIQYFICSTNLENINPCDSRTPDVLVIWNNKSFTTQINTIKKYLDSGNGIVEIADFPNGVNTNQTIIFKIKNYTGNYNASENNDTFNVPSSAFNISYLPYKYFRHIPLAVNSFTEVASIPIENNILPCTGAKNFTGIFRFYERNYSYWICGANRVYRVYFDTDNNGMADIIVTQRQNFNINGTYFYMKFINENSFGIVFNNATYNAQAYKFKDFLKSGNTKVYPSDDDVNKIFLYNGKYSGTNDFVPVVVLNDAGNYRTAWIADFTRDGLDLVGDDQKLLLISLLLWASNKHYISDILSNLEFGYTTSYINTVNDDMFEVYTFTLGLGKPY
jgi:hypothetical protein